MPWVRKRRTKRAVPGRAARCVVRWHAQGCAPMRCFAWHEHRTVLVCATVRHCAGCCRAVIAALRAPSPTTVLARNGLVSVPRHYRHQCDTQCQQCRHVLLTVSDPNTLDRSTQSGSRPRVHPELACVVSCAVSCAQTPSPLRTPPRWCVTSSAARRARRASWRNR